MKKILLLPLLAAFLFSGCSSYTITKESLVEQLNANQNIEKTNNISSVGMGYYSNNLKKIKCVDKSGQNVWLYAGKNMNFKFTNISEQKTVTVYFDTVLLQNDTLYGLKSRIVGGKRKIPVNDIAKIEIHVEEAQTEPAN